MEGNMIFIKNIIYIGSDVLLEANNEKHSDSNGDSTKTNQNHLNNGVGFVSKSDIMFMEL